MQGFTRITSVRIDLRGRHPFAAAYGDLALVEAEVRQLALPFFAPGYPTRTNPERRRPDIIFKPATGEDSLNPPSIDPFVPPATCGLMITNTEAGSLLEFKGPERQRLRRVLVPTEEFSTAVHHYRDQIAVADQAIAELMAELKKQPDYDPNRGLLPKPSDSKATKILKLRITDTEYNRRDAHNAGSEAIYTIMRRHGVILRNGYMTQDLEMRVFELLSFLVSEPSSAPVAALMPVRHGIGLRAIEVTSPSP